MPNLNGAASPVKAEALIFPSPIVTEADDAAPALDVDAAISFLRRFNPPGPWVLMAISDDKKTLTKTFDIGQETALARWLEARQGDQWNAYFLVGEAKKPLSKKPAKSDMARSRWLWVDIDARDDLDWSSDVAVQEEMDAIKARIDGFTVQPTVIIASGGGYQAFWKLDEPFELGAVARNAELESFNRAISRRLGGDHCHNVDRVMRLPGTINFPTVTKRAAGRLELTQARLVAVKSGDPWPIEALDMLRAEAPQMDEAGGSALAALPKKLQKAVQASDAGDRSRAFYAACCALFDLGRTEAEAVAIFEAAPAGVGAKFIDRGDLANEVSKIRGKWRPRGEMMAPGAGEARAKNGRIDIKLEAGEQARITDEALAVIQRHGVLYERAKQLVRIADGRPVETDTEWLLDYLSRRVNFWRLKASDEGFKRAESDPPMWLGKRINAKTGERGLPELESIISTPTMRRDGSLITAPGYDAQTKLLLLPGDYPEIPLYPTRAELEDAWRILWKPFEEFPYAEDSDRHGAASSLFTRVVRKTLPEAPAYSFDAPKPSSGKTLLASCVALLCSNELNLIPQSKEEEELRKKILSTLLDDRDHAVFDNVTGHFKSSAMEALLTSERYSDRILGASKMPSFLARIMILISGNNFRPSGDLWRRIITVRIDAKDENPERRSFKLEPKQFICDHRQGLVAAALTLLRGYHADGAPRYTTDRIGSFEVWDDMVRQPVIWLGKQGIALLEDPAVAMSKAKELDPALLKLDAFLEAVFAVKKDSSWSANALAKEANDQAIRSDRPLYDALLDVARDGHSINNRIMGNWLSSNTDNRRAGGRIVRGKPLHGYLQYSIIRDAPVPAPQ